MMSLDHGASGVMSDIPKKETIGMDCHACHVAPKKWQRHNARLMLELLQAPALAGFQLRAHQVLRVTILPTQPLAMDPHTAAGSLMRENTPDI